MTRFSLALAAAAVAGLSAMPSVSEAGILGGGGGRTAVWVVIDKHVDEGIWEACRRVYRRDVYQVRGAGPHRARCFIDASAVGDPRGRVGLD